MPKFFIYYVNEIRRVCDLGIDMRRKINKTGKAATRKITDETSPDVLTRIYACLKPLALMAIIMCDLGYLP